VSGPFLKSTNASSGASRSICEQEKPADTGEKKIAALLSEAKELREQNRQLALEVNRLGRLILGERGRADRTAVYEKKNISLREEIRRNYGRDVRKEAVKKIRN
jgi:hypothetical protein